MNKKVQTWLELAENDLEFAEQIIQNKQRPYVDAPIEALGYTPQEIAEKGKDSIIWEAVQKNHKLLYKAA